MKRHLRQSNRTAANGPALVDTPTVAAALSMTPAQVLRLQRIGKIPAIKIGHRTLRYNLEAVFSALAA